MFIGNTKKVRKLPSIPSGLPTAVSPVQDDQKPQGNGQSYQNKLRDWYEIAEFEEKNGRKREAIKAYYKSLDALTKCIQLIPISSQRTDIVAKGNEILRRIDILENQCQDQYGGHESLDCYSEAGPSRPMPYAYFRPGSGCNSEDSGVGLGSGSGSGAAFPPPANIAEQLVVDGFRRCFEKMNAPWASIVGYNDVKEMIQTTFIFPRQLGSRNGCRATNMLLFGPPGTGKTQIAKCFASELDWKMIAVSTSDIADIHVGGSTVRCKCLFNAAKLEGPCIMFFDEMEQMLQPRETTRDEHDKQFVAEFLCQMNKLEFHNTTNMKKEVFVVGCTNFPYNIDSAVLRRMKSPIFVPLPTEEDRRNIVTSLFKQTSPFFAFLDWETLMLLTKGWTTSDMVDLKDKVQSGLNAKSKKATHFQHYCGPDPCNPLRIVEGWMPCHRTERDAIPIDFEEVKMRIVLPVPSVRDVLTIAGSKKSTINKEEKEGSGSLAQCVKFNEAFGQTVGAKLGFDEDNDFDSVEFNKKAQDRMLECGNQEEIFKSKAYYDHDKGRWVSLGAQVKKKQTNASQSMK